MISTLGRNPKAQQIFSFTPCTVSAKEHWLPALLMWRKPFRFEMRSSDGVPEFTGSGLPTKGLPLTDLFNLTIEQSSWWLRLFDLATLKFTRRDAASRGIHVFIGRVATVEGIQDSVTSAVRKSFASMEEHLTSLIVAFEQEHRAIFLQSRYVRHSQLVRLLNKHPELARPDALSLVDLWSRHPMQVSDLKRSTLEKRVRAGLKFFADPEGARKVHNDAFVLAESKIHANYFASIESSELNPEQITASLHFDDANVTVAAAGSGKTSVIVSKVGYAIKSGLLQGREVMVLAFNKEAAKELKTRIEKGLKSVVEHEVKVEARTFHSLGLALWIKRQKEQGLPSRPRLIDFERSGADDDGGGDEARTTRSLSGKWLIRSALVELAADCANSDFAGAVMKWASEHRYPIPELESCSGETLDERQQRYDQMCHRIARRKGKVKWTDPDIPTFDPKIWVRSTEEARLCNWLYLRDISFEYERCAPSWLKDKVNEGLPAEEHVKIYRPDFTYPNPADKKQNFFHEHFGLNKQGCAPKFMGPIYEQRALHKRKVLTKALSRKGAPSRFIETTSAQFADDSLFEDLTKQLCARGIHVGDINQVRWEAALRTLLEDKSIVDLIAKFVVGLKDSGLTLDQVQERANGLGASDSERATAFLKWMRPLLKRLDEKMAQGIQISSGTLSRPLIDFATMIGGAVAALKNWQTGSLPYKLILVDEFQDISRLRAQLVQGLLDQNPDDSMLYCVGDDWQSINRFAGSDVGIFRAVYDGHRMDEKDRGDTPMVSRWSAQSILQQTYRCPQGIADVARWFVMRGGANSDLIDKPVKSINPSCAKVIKVLEHEDSGDARYAALVATLERIASQRETHGDKEVSDVYILTRNKSAKSMPEGIDSSALNRLTRRFSSKGLKISRYSMHGSKGLGAEYVILVGMDSGKGGYPGDFVDDPLIDMLLPFRRSPLDEERRLFYVGLTRAKIEVTILCVGNRPSPFVQELEAYPESGVIVFDKLPGVVRYLCPKCKLGWLQNLYAPGRVGCTRSPFCGFVGSEKVFSNLPPHPSRQQSYSR